MLSSLSAIFGIFFVSMENVFSAIQVLFSILMLTFSIMLASIFWKLRLNDQRPDLLLSAQKTLVALGVCHILGQISLIIVSHITDLPYYMDSSDFFILAVPLGLTVKWLIEIYRVELLSDPFQMLLVSLLLNSLAFCWTLTELFLKLVMLSRLRKVSNVSSFSMIEAAEEETAFSLVFILLSLVILVRIFYIWITTDFIFDGTNKEKTTTPIIPRTCATPVPVTFDLIKSNLDLISSLRALHFWNLIGAFVSLSGLSSTMPLLFSAVLIGAIINHIPYNGSRNNQELFFTLTSSQKKNDTTF